MVMMRCGVVCRLLVVVNGAAMVVANLIVMGARVVRIVSD